MKSSEEAKTSHEGKVSRKSKRMGLEWVNRHVFANPVYIALATCEAAFQKEIKKLGIPDGAPSSQAAHRWQG